MIFHVFFIKIIGWKLWANILDFFNLDFLEPHQFNFLLTNFQAISMTTPGCFIFQKFWLEDFQGVWAIWDALTEYSLHQLHVLLIPQQPITILPHFMLQKAPHIRHEPLLQLSSLRRILRRQRRSTTRRRHAVPEEGHAEEKFIVDSLALHLYGNIKLHRRPSRNLK